MSRITSVDALRGLTIAFMILVNDPGDWTHVYCPLDHAEWNGFTPTDLVFPTFLFLVGCSIVFSVPSRLARGVSRRTIALQIAPPRRPHLRHQDLPQRLPALPHDAPAPLRRPHPHRRSATSSPACSSSTSAAREGPRRNHRRPPCRLLGADALRPHPRSRPPGRRLPHQRPRPQPRRLDRPRLQCLCQRTIHTGAPLRTHPRPRGPPQHPPLHRHHPARHLRGPLATRKTLRRHHSQYPDPRRPHCPPPRPALEPQLPHQQKALDQFLTFSTPQAGRSCSSPSPSGSSTRSSFRSAPASPAERSGPCSSSAPTPSRPTASRTCS